MARAWRCRLSSQAIVCVQLLAWCVAACLLLYRGVTTLRREPPVQVALANATAGNDTARSTPPPAAVLRAPPPADEAAAAAASDSAYAAKKGAEEASVLYVPSHMTIPAAAAAGAAQGAGAWPEAEGAGAGAGHRSSFGRLRSELRPASLILIVLGFSMLLVGPVVVVLRKCDSTLHHRRVAKLPTDEEDACDPPPSYDEATLGCGGAPRYSTLFEVRDSGELVCLNAPPPPPAPAPSGGPRAHPAAAAREADPACAAYR
ncbi:hypothetical protein R5R35_008358 [Gryllus longicercus]|uniref:Uncharacterized protein n=1 Tax=Gryllus longicercus TaxID=2509291 RepID=A0AAN9VZS8_9ORTH